MADTAIAELRTCTKCGLEKPADREHFPPVGKGLRPRCRPCWRAHEREYFWNNREAKREAAKRRWARADKAAERAKVDAWRAANPDKARAMEVRRLERIKADPLLKAKAAERMQRWREVNPEKEIECRRRQMAKDPLAVARYSRAYADRHPERLQAKGRAWREKNPAKVIAYSEMRRQRVREAEGEITEQVVLDLIERSRMKCFYCETKLTGFHVDHFIPVTRGGTNLPDNLRIACGRCNRRKSNKLLWEWKPERFTPP